MSSSLICHEVEAVGFGFFSPEEIHQLSVKAITAPYVFDNIGQPVPNGLYDPAFGPISMRDICQTCGQKESDCPGHMGHVDLSVPVFQPLLFDLLFKLLKAKCFVCHRFRIPEFKTKVLLTKLLLLEAGLLLKIKDVDDVVTAYSSSSVVVKEEKDSKKKTKTPKRKKRLNVSEANMEDEPEKRDSDEEDEEEEEMDNGKQSRASVREAQEEALQKAEKQLDKLQELAQRVKSKRGNSIFERTPSQQEQHLHRDLVKSFFKDIAKKCPHCSAFSPALKRDGHTKIFRKPLSREHDSHNKLHHLSINNILKTMNDSDSNVVGSLEEKISDIGGSQLQTKSKKKKKDATPEASESDSSDDETIKPSKTAHLPSSARPKLMFPNEVEKHMKLLWDKEKHLASHLFGALAHLGLPSEYAGILRHSDYRMFFVRVLAIPPSKYRPPSFMNGQQYESAQNTYIRTILEYDIKIRNLSRKQQQQPSEADLENIVSSWLLLQANVNMFLDNSKGGEYAPLKPSPGIRQIFEKKEGLFRRNMMGKRVNYAARSVISPDPFLHTAEIGVPESFAKTLTYPEPVTSHNIHMLRQMVLNGPQVHPGANAIVDERGRTISLDVSYEKRVALSKTLFTTSLVETHFSSGKSSEVTQSVGKKVLRHLITGDVLLVNRQPTLHKPSMMCHRARVLSGQQWHTIRMHYANCNTYNADFDGDEMNLHFPQNELARAECYTIANNDNQYLVPVDGSPLRGLIQDHVVASVLLTMKDTFLTKEKFQELLWYSLSPAVCESSEGVGFSSASAGPSSSNSLASAAASHSPSLTYFTSRLPSPTPAVLKPQPLYTGKQVITSLLAFLCGSRPPINLECKAKVSAASWGKGTQEIEGKVVIRANELVCGVLDKSQIGDAGYGLTHAVYELLGPAACGHFLSSMSRLLTIYLNWQGFTCGIADMLVREPFESQRQEMIKKATLAGHKASAEYAFQGLNEVDKDKKLVADEIMNALTRHEEKVHLISPTNPLHDQLAAFIAPKVQQGAQQIARLDSMVKNTLSTFTSDIIKNSIPQGQVKPFPDNCMSMMTLTGAKGSMVNFAQITCLLGQQELEGKRVPLLPSGKSLPCFRAYDTQPRAGGYVANRFLTGVKPQEFFFHCMAGREGLIDTAVKTSRSGYLQRCIIKHLESLCVQYDHTVRDADFSVVQFNYGEDAVDISKAAFFDKDKMNFLAQNYMSLLHRLQPAQALRKMDSVTAQEYERHQQENSKLDPVLSVLPPGQYLGSVSEAFKEAVDEYITKDPDGLFLASKLREEEEQQGEKKKKKKKKGADGDEVIASHLPTVPSQFANKFRVLMNLYYASSLAHPGECVGVLAGQSIGEPSTQMTLNTFHLAGHGGANVTLGIPRLREILMTASQKIKTPIMEIPLLASYVQQQCIKGLDRKIKEKWNSGALATEEKQRLLSTTSKTLAEQICAELSKIPMQEIVNGLSVSQQLRKDGARLYRLRLEFIDNEQRPKHCSWFDVVRCFLSQVVFRLHKLMEKELQRTSTVTAVKGRKEKVMRARGGGEEGEGEREEKEDAKEKDDDDDDDGREDDDEADADDAVSAKLKAKKRENASYDDEDEEDKQAKKAQDKDEELDDDNPDDEINAKAAEEDEDEDDDEDSMADEDSEKDKSKSADALIRDLIRTAKTKCRFVDSVNLDSKKQSYAECVFALPHDLRSERSLLMVSLAEKAVESAILHQVKGISRCMVLEKKTESGEKEWVVQSDGVNFSAVWALSDRLDCSRIDTNDVGSVLRYYGVEAARHSIVKQITAVFAVYGITIDARHLYLIADYMTQLGGFRPLNRQGMEPNPSTFQKASFETSMGYILQACLHGQTDTLISPSSRIVLGIPARGGTGMFELRQKLI